MKPDVCIPTFVCSVDEELLVGLQNDPLVHHIINFKRVWDIFHNKACYIPLENYEQALGTYTQPVIKCLSGTGSWLFRHIASSPTKFIGWKCEWRDCPTLDEEVVHTPFLYIFASSTRRTTWQRKNIIVCGWKCVFRWEGVIVYKRTSSSPNANIMKHVYTPEVPFERWFDTMNRFKDPKSI